MEKARNASKITVRKHAGKRPFENLRRMKKNIINGF
jgi:hypothetical protein